MLILSRLPGERILIGTGDDAVILSLLKTNGNEVKFGIDAPKHIGVFREEVFLKLAKRGVITAGVELMRRLFTQHKKGGEEATAETKQQKEGEEQC